MTGTDLWTALAALAASASALFAALYTWLTYRMVRVLSEANVVVYVHHDESRSTLLQIIVENVGNGLATDVRFRPSRPIPEHAFGFNDQDIRDASQMSSGPLITGIPTLGPRDTRKITWGQYGGLKRALGDEPIVLRFDYVTAGRRVREREAILEIHSFESTDAVDSEGARVIKELKKIAGALEAVVRELRDSRAQQHRVATGSVGSAGPHNAAPGADG
ncbi:MAG TPA: hypothetical protein VGC93_11990 [Thermoanaerobaculia bacterium]